MKAEKLFSPLMLKEVKSPLSSGFNTSLLLEQIKIDDNDRQKYIKEEFDRLLLNPLRILAYLTAISGLFALLFEVRHFTNHSVEIYAARFFAIAIAFWVLLTTNFNFGEKHPVLLVHTLLLTIICSFGAVIYILPGTLVVNSSIAAITIFTAAIFLSWEVKNQIVVAIYYNLVFAATILYADKTIYFVPNMPETFLFIIFVSVLSIGASSYNYKLRKDSILKTFAVAVSEQKFRSIFENSNDGIFQVNLNGNLMLANSALIKMLNYENEEDLNDINFLNEVILDKVERKEFFKKLRKNGIVKDQRIKLLKKDGVEIIGKINCRVVNDQIGLPEYIEGSIQDITNQVKIENDLIQAKEKAEQSDKLKSEFLSQMSHEIRTPINVLMNFGELMKDELEEKGSDDLKSTFKLINSASKRIIRTIDLILNMSEIQTGTYQYSPKIFDIYNEILRVLYYDYKKQAEDKKIELFFTRNTSYTLLKADLHSVYHIFSNLIDNAIKYTSNGSIEISLGKDKLNNLTVTVSDTGIGISKEYSKKLFEPFSQEEQGFSRRYEGNGLGLALVKKYCDLNNAELEVESEKGKGSTFKVTFLD